MHGVPQDSVLRVLRERSDLVHLCGELALRRQHEGREEDATCYKTFACKTPYSSAMSLRSKMAFSVPLQEVPCP